MHGSGRRTPDRSRDRRSAKDWPRHCARPGESWLARRRPLPRLSGRGLRGHCEDRGWGRKGGRVPRRSLADRGAGAAARELRRDARTRHLPDQQRRLFRVGRYRYAQPGELAEPFGRQSARAGLSRPGLRPPLAERRERQYSQHHRPEGAQPRPRVFLLHHRQVCAVDGDADFGTGACPFDQGECHCARPCAAELEARR